MDELHAYGTELYDFPAPVDHDGSRTYDKKMASGILRMKMRHGGNGLDRLAKSHFIAKNATMRLLKHKSHPFKTSFLIGI